MNNLHLNTMRVWACSAFVIILLFAGATNAFGFGLGYTLSLPSERFNPSHTSESFHLFMMLVRSLQGSGITIDTAAAERSLFSYRAELSVQNRSLRINLLANSFMYSTSRINWHNTFGFAFIHTDLLRVWAGPHASFAYEFIDNSNVALNPVIYTSFGHAAGFDFKANDEIIFTFELGLRNGFGVRIYNFADKRTFHTGFEPFAGIRLLFRTWDLTAVNTI